MAYSNAEKLSKLKQYISQAVVAENSWQNIKTLFLALPEDIRELIFEYIESEQESLEDQSERASEQIEDSEELATELQGV